MSEEKGYLVLDHIGELLHLADLHPILLCQEIDLVDEVQGVLELVEVLGDEVGLESPQDVDVLPCVEVHEELGLLLVDVFVVLSEERGT